MRRLHRASSGAARLVVSPRGTSVP